MAVIDKGGRGQRNRTQSGARPNAVPNIWEKYNNYDSFATAFANYYSSGNWMQTYKNMPAKYKAWADKYIFKFKQDQRLAAQAAAKKAANVRAASDSINSRKPSGKNSSNTSAANKKR